MILKFAKYFGYAFVLACMTVNAVYAGSSDCMSIDSHDGRNYCLGIAEQDAGFFGAIDDKDMKNMCLAQVKRDKMYCMQMDSKDSQQQCLAMF